MLLFSIPKRTITFLSVGLCFTLLLSCFKDMDDELAPSPCSVVNQNILGKIDTLNFETRGGAIFEQRIDSMETDSTTVTLKQLAFYLTDVETTCSTDTAAYQNYIRFTVPQEVGCYENVALQFIKRGDTTITVQDSVKIGIIDIKENSVLFSVKASTISEADSIPPSTFVEGFTELSLCDE